MKSILLFMVIMFVIELSSAVDIDDNKHLIEMEVVFEHVMSDDGIGNELFGGWTSHYTTSLTGTVKDCWYQFVLVEFDDGSEWINVNNIMKIKSNIIKNNL